MACAPGTAARRDGPANARLAAACAETRGRVALADPARLDEAALQATGVQGVMHLKDGILHLLLGLNADQFAAEMRAVMAGGG